MYKNSKEVFSYLREHSKPVSLFTREIEYATEEILSFLLPERAVSDQSQKSFDSVLEELENCIRDTVPNAKNILQEFVSQLPEIFNAVQEDIDSAYLNDPAAKSHDEVRSCYPGILAIATYRLANFFEQSSTSYIPRIMTEWAHRMTGIDIHPGAKIAPSFFIDHGTGVVIGETVVIEKGVKIYQGVTLGAKSFPVDSEGNPCKGIQRHPKVQEGVVIYANTTILGGDTVIGSQSEIGAGLFITESIPAGSLVVGVSEGSGQCYKVLNKKS